MPSDGSVRRKRKEQMTSTTHSSAVLVESNGMKARRATSARSRGEVCIATGGIAVAASRRRHRSLTANQGDCGGSWNH